MSAAAVPDICDLGFPQPRSVTSKIRFGTRTVYNQDESRQLVCSGSIGTPDGTRPLAVECDIIAAVYELHDPSATDIGTRDCALVSAATEGGRSAAVGVLCGYLSDALGTGAGLFAAGVSKNPAVGVRAWKGVTFFANTAVCVGLVGGGAKAWGYNHESDHEIAVARDIIRRSKCLQLTEQRALRVSRLNWSAVSCPRGFENNDHSPFHRPVLITAEGAVGSLQTDLSTAADIQRALGLPDYTTTGSFDNSGGIPYQLFGYECSEPGNCTSNYYVNVDTGRFESFETTSAKFALPGGIRVGMSADTASRWERRPVELGCAGIERRISQRLTVLIWTHGGRRLQNGHVIGARVAGIALDGRHGIGAVFC